MSTDQQAIAERMRLARRIAGLTQEDAARALDVTVRTYGRWETGETSGFLSELDRIAKVLGTTAEELRADDEAVADAADGDRIRALEGQLSLVLRELRDLRALLEERLP